MKKMLEKFMAMDKKLIKEIGIGILALVVIFGIIFWAKDFGNNLSPDKAKTLAENYINDNLLGGQTTIKIDEITDNNGIYKVKFNLNGQPIESYLTKDGKLFFPKALEMSTSSATTTAKNNEQQKASTGVVKSDKPKVELFVMSYCPYGTQIEKGILPAIQALGSAVDFSLKFVSYSMHGQKELDENLRQTCINKTQPEKLFPYLTCFLKAGDFAGCLSSTAVNQGLVNTCVKSTDTQFKVTEQFTKKQNWKGQFPPFDVNAADNTKYGVQGSPTLVINGAQAESGRDSASLLKTICGAFTTQPGVCSTSKLSSVSPAPGFGTGTDTSGGSNADCATN